MRSETISEKIRLCGKI